MTTGTAARPHAFRGPAAGLRELRDALGSFATGVTVMTTLAADGQPVGLTCNSFNSVSLDPPLVVWSLSLTTPSLAAFQASDRFTVNVLAADQIELARQFARRGTDKFAGVRTIEGLYGLPLIENACAWFECRMAARHDGGDHRLFLGAVERFAHWEREPLLFWRGAYGRVEGAAG